MIRRVCFSITLGVSASLLSPPVHADDGNTEPTPVGFPARTCTLELDRSREEAVTFRPTLPFEDTNLGIHEPPNSRRVQLFAFCQSPLPGVELPPWISILEAEGAVTRGELSETPPAERILETSAWASMPGHDGVDGTCVWPLQTPAQRLPLSCEATQVGVTWNGADVPAGLYSIWAYTYAPPNHVWRPRPGVVWVHDGQDTAPPASAPLLGPIKDANLGGDAPLAIRGCAPTPDEHQLHLQWASTFDDPTNDDSWVDIDSTPEFRDDTWTLDWSLPVAANGKAVFLRASATPAGQAPDASTEWSYAPGRVVVAEALTTSTAESGNPPFDICGVDVPTTKPRSEGCTVVDTTPASRPWTSLGWLLVFVPVTRRRLRGLRPE